MGGTRSNVAKFQNMFADFTGSKYAHAASNCTTALHLGLEAMGITKGDKVIVPSFTCKQAQMLLNIQVLK
ncbi:hypothetical protein MASR2M54_12630 [Aliarcobacter cryaerophilus]